MKAATALFLLAALGAALAEAGAKEAPRATKPVEEMTLEELLQVEVSVPTRLARPLRETPGVVTVVTHDEIAHSGARDLIDVLHLVPGFAFGVDVQGAVSVGFRGNWGEEGKVLLLLDGQELNETLYLTVQFGNRYPVDLIERVEVMRGPGSVVYGGYAELAVINIVTRLPSSLDGAFASATLGQMDQGIGRRNFSLYAGHVFENLSDLTVSVAAFAGEARRSDQLYSDFYGNQYRLSDARLSPALLSLGIAYRGLSFRLLLDGYSTRTRDAFDQSLPDTVDTDFTGAHAELKYTLALGDKATLVPRLSFKSQKPWRVLDLRDGAPVYYDKTGERLLGSLLLTLEPVAGLTVLAGAEAAEHSARLNDLSNLGVGLQLPFGEATRTSFQTYSGYASAELEHPWVNLSLGGRFEHNSRFGSRLLPRAALTRAFGRFHAKLLFSQAFKAPGHENFALNPALRPELTTTYELEAGYQLARWLFVGANAFDLTIKDPIIFTFEGGAETYANFERTGSRGLEAVARFSSARFQAAFQYSYYTALGKNAVPTYAIDGAPSALRGFPNHKLTFDGTLSLAEGLSLRGEAILLGTRYGALEADADGNPVVGAEGPTLLVNAFLSWDVPGLEGFNVGAGAYNLLDVPYRFLQPHDSGHAPLPGPSREYLARIAFTHGFE